MSTTINVTVGGNGLLDQSKQQTQANRLGRLEADADQRAADDAAAKRGQQQQLEGRSPVSRRRIEPAASRRTTGLFFIASGFNSSYSSQQVIYQPPSGYPAYPDEQTKHVWTQVQSGELRFLVNPTSDSDQRRVITESIPTHAQGYSWRLTSNNQAIYLAWNYDIGGDPPVAHWGTAFLPSAPMVAVQGSTVWITWNYSMDFSTGYYLGTVGGDSIQVARPSLAYKNILRFARYNTKTGSLETKTAQYNNDENWWNHYLANCYNDDPAKAVRALSYAGYYSVSGSTADFLAAYSDTYPFYEKWPCPGLRDPDTGLIPATSWVLETRQVNNSTTQTLYSSLIGGGGTLIREQTVRFPQAKQDTAEDALFLGTGVSPVPGWKHNYIVPVYVS